MVFGKHEPERLAGHSTWPLPVWQPGEFTMGE